MARTPQDLGQGQLTTSAAALATSSSGTNTIIRRLTFSNTSATTNILVTVYRVVSGATAGDAGTLLVKRTIPFGKAWVCQEAEGHVLAAGASIQALADTTATIDYNISGTSVT